MKIKVVEVCKFVKYVFCLVPLVANVNDKLQHSAAVKR
jgi:hypothetical protein